MPLPYLANATDFAALEAEPSVDLAYAERPGDLEHADVVVLPGTKDTLGALDWLDGAWADAVRAFATHGGAAHHGGAVLGICGGYQVLGERVADPHGVERGSERAGLGLLPVRTVLEWEKITRAAAVTLRPGALFGRSDAVRGTGYEIHMGRTVATAGTESAFADLTYGDGSYVVDGAVSANAAIVGTYLHGFFADDALRWVFVAAARRGAGLRPAERLTPYAAQRETQHSRARAFAVERVEADGAVSAAGHAAGETIGAGERLSYADSIVGPAPNYSVRPMKSTIADRSARRQPGRRRTAY